MFRQTWVNGVCLLQRLCRVFHSLQRTTRGGQIPARPTTAFEKNRACCIRECVRLLNHVLQTGEVRHIQTRLQ